mgnify:CR=1 FL=1
MCYNTYIEKEESQLNRFVREYNSLFNVPNYKINTAICQEYRRDHETEFKISDWSIVKHRKRFMDWLSKQKPEFLKNLK